MFSFIDFGIKDAIDIGLTTLIIYQIFTRLKQRYILLFLKVLGVFLIVYEVVNFLGFELLSFLLDRIKEIAFIGAIVIFAKEFRKALFSLLPSRKLLGEFDVDTFAETLTETLHELAASRKGAIIILEGKMAINDVLDIARATKLFIPFEKEYVLNLFDKSNPLHDGAIIIKDGIITHANVNISRISNAENLPPDLGTRHRAGLAVTEGSDALVFIVSEERGEISMAYDGNLKRNPGSLYIKKQIKKFYDNL